MNEPSADESPDRGSLDPERWLGEHGDYLYNLAYLRLRDTSAAEDVVQDTFLAALRARERFEGRSSERTWLVAILRSKIIDHLRRRFRDALPTPEETTPDEALDGFTHEGVWVGHWAPGWRPVDWGDDPSQLLERREFWEVLGQCLAKLPPRMSAVFVLHEIEGVASDEICKDLGVTASNLWVLLHRARHQLRLCLEKNWMGGTESTNP